MLLRHFYDTTLAQASWMLACQATGEALVVDPLRDVRPYLAVAEAEGVRITHVTETHIHADFVSGSRELAARVGARLLLSAEGGRDWQYAWAAEAGATLLHDGDVIQVGNVRVDVLHTPGHTPEHLSFLVTDTPVSARPMGIFTGDFVFVGDVGRPDLLERAAGVANTMEASARALHRSLDRFRALPDWVQVWPGHGAGSACGKALGAIPSSTVGYERLTNWALQATSEDAFVQAVLSGQPEPPKYFATMKRVNRDGPLVIGDPRPVPQLPGERLTSLLDAGALVVDTRTAAEFARGHVPGALSLPLAKSFLTWSGALLPYDRPIHLIVDDASGAVAQEAARQLMLIGLDRVAGWLDAGALDTWRANGRALERSQEMTVRELATHPDGAVVIDVRNRSEWEAGHMPGVPVIPLAELPDRLAEIPRDRPVVLHCQGGGRSAIAASLLQANGFADVTNLTGGFGAWEKEGLAVEKPAK